MVSLVLHSRCKLVPYLAAMLLAGCAGHAPTTRPDASLPSAWPGNSPGTSASTIGGENAAKVTWQSYFTDPRLQALIALALANNRDLRIAAAKVEQGRAQWRVARADRLPSADLQLTESRAYTPPTLTTGSSSQRFDLQSLLSYEVDFWGRVASMSESARASFLATEDARREVQLSLITDVAQAYFSTREKDELIELAGSILELREQSLTIVTRGRDAGGADEDERQQALAALEACRATMAQLEHERAVSMNQLNFLVGRVAGDLPVGKSLAEQQPGVALSPGLPSEVLLHRPDVMAAEQRLVAANADIDAARAAYFPKVMLTAALGFASPALAGLFSGGAWSYQPLISAPLFDGGRTAGNADAARARGVIAVAEYEKTMQQAFREVADQLSARTSLRRQLEAAVATQQVQQSRLKMARGRYEAGVSGYREVLESQRGLLAARQNTLSVRRAEQDVAAKLYKALGGGADDDTGADGAKTASAAGSGDLPAAPRRP